MLERGRAGSSWQSWDRGHGHGHNTPTRSTHTPSDQPARPARPHRVPSKWLRMLAMTSDTSSLQSGSMNTGTSCGQEQQPHGVAVS